MARQALQLIGQQRGSEALSQYPDTGELVLSEMDPSQAYLKLRIDDATVPDDLVVSAYEVAVADAPSQKHDLTRALRSIAKERKSPMLFNLAGNDSTMATLHNPSDWPVGLDNIGNTCYLNSLLQYFFTIKPLRSLVLNNQDYMMHVDGGTLQKKQVGSRLVTKREIERAQKC